ncbi:hypothetical protein BXU11_05890 [Flavobacterium sp. LM5]|uniref:GLPGLI family protein n=1 Tax=Flavobacterium sp. LM5 TaxID=1938610 RepID=UPI000992D830|nr:GLPGLI family protein [Flavobacterium sp. LM5]OOV29419.1 hypothetical protein BXU11_05890 [Flavobacterium sp. LM5]
MNYLKYLILFFLLENMNAQKVEIDFVSIINTNNVISSSKTDYKLILNDSTSYYFNTLKDESQYRYVKNAFEKKQVDDVTEIKLSDNHIATIKDDFFYKNFIKDTLIYNEIISTKKVFVGEKSNLFEWQIKPISDTLVFGFKCQKATTKFRGRTYEATFSSEIAPNGGPWKFDGLPGIIISIKSLDNYFAIYPVKIVLNKKQSKLYENIYKDKKVISWNEYRKMFRENMERRLKILRSKSETGEGGSIKITDKIEDLEIPEMKF